MSIHLVGDTHGGWDGSFKPLNTSNFPEQKNMTKNDFIIQLGDFGLWWDFYDTKEERYWRSWLMKKKFQFCFIDGNHENFPKLKREFVDIEFKGGKAKEYRLEKFPEFGSIIWLQRGEVYNFDGTKIFVMGGAMSHDKEHRTNGISWWEEEVPNYEEMNNGLDNLKKHSFSVDYVLTHTVPSQIIYDMFGLDDSRSMDHTSKYFDALIDNDEFLFSKWHCGHFHVNTYHTHNGRLFRCHYNAKHPYKLV